MENFDFNVADLIGMLQVMPGNAPIEIDLGDRRLKIVGAFLEGPTGEPVGWQEDEDGLSTVKIEVRDA